MNVLPPKKIADLHELFASGVGVRQAARTLNVNRGTVARYRRCWVEAELQRAYDLLWDGDCEGCDEITAKLPTKDVSAMLDAWMDDQDPKNTVKSKWH
jgi:hypothetical protein